MGLNVQKGVISSPASTGTQTYSLAANFDPKALICWWTNQTAEGIVDDAQLGFGVAADRGGTAVQRAFAVTSNDAAVAGDNSSLMTASAIARLLSPGLTTSLATVAFVSFSTGATSNFVLDWTDLPDSVGTKLHYLVLGGSDITDAQVGGFDLSTTSPQDVTVEAGFGQPDLLLFLSAHLTSAASSTSTGQAMIGWAKSDTVRRCAVWNEDEGSATIDVGFWNKDRAILMLDNAGNTADAEADLDAKANWPTDGFRLTIPDVPAVATQDVYYLALKGTFQSQIDSSSSPTGAPTVNQDNDAGFAPAAAMVWGSGLDAKTTIDTTHANLGQFYVGATDGTNEGWAGMSEEDGAADADTYSYHSESKTIQIHNADDSTLLAEGDGSFTGNNFRIAWNDTDGTAREYNWVVLGAAGGAQSWNGAVVLPFTFTPVVTGRVNSKTNPVVSPFTFGEVVAGKTVRYGRVDSPFSFDRVTAGNKVALGVVDSPFTFGRVTQAKVVAKSRVDSPFTFERVVSARVHAFSRVDSPFTFERVIVGRVHAFSRVDSPFSFNRVIAAKVGVKGAVSLPFSFGEVVAARLVAKGAIVLPFNFNITVAGAVASANLVISPFTFGRTVTGLVAHKTNPVVSPFIFGETVAGRVGVKSSVVSPFTFNELVAARVGAHSSVVSPFTFERVIAAKVRAKGAVVFPIVFGIFTQAQGAGGIVVSPFTFGRVVSGTVTRKGQVVSPFTFGELVAGKVGAHALVTSPFTFDETVVGRISALGRIDFPITFAIVTVGTVIPVLVTLDAIYTGQIGRAESGGIGMAENGEVSDTVAGILEEVLTEA